MKELLEQADQNFDRLPTPGIYDLYLKYIETGKYPYLPEVTAYILDVAKLPASLEDQVHHEVYLASHQKRDEEKNERKAKFISEGYSVANANEIEDGKHYWLIRYTDGMFTTGTKKEVKVRARKTEEDNGYNDKKYTRVFFFPAGHTRTGYLLERDSEYYIKEATA